MQTRYMRACMLQPRWNLRSSIMVIPEPDQLLFVWPSLYVHCVYVTGHRCKTFLRAPCVADADTIFVLWFLLIMAALWNRAGHYTFALWFLSYIFFFFPHLISASEIGCLPYFHTWCGLSANRMHVWNVLHAARWKYRTQKIAILAPSHKFVWLCLRS